MVEFSTYGISECGRWRVDNVGIYNAHTADTLGARFRPVIVENGRLRVDTPEFAKVREEARKRVKGEIAVVTTPTLRTYRQF